MSLRVVIHEAAEAEINEAADFYDLESPGLGTIFIDDVSMAINRIAEMPEAAPLVKDRIRKKLLIKFPYSLFYSKHQEEIRILAVVHHKRRPFYWRSRLY